MEEQLKATIDQLNTLLGHSIALKGVNEKLGEAQAKLAATEKDLEETTAVLGDKTKLLDENRARAAKEHDSAMYEKSEKLKMLSAQINSASDELEQLRETLVQTRADHDAVLASFQELRKRLA